MKVSNAEREHATAELRGMVKAGDTVYCLIRHVSRSGMQREISFFLEGMRNIDWYVSRILENRIGKHYGVVVGGCGMDMGFATVYSLASTLFPDGFTCTGRDQHPDMCPSSDHSNGDRNYQPHIHASGGYALRHRWI